MSLNRSTILNPMSNVLLAINFANPLLAKFHSTVYFLTDFFGAEVPLTAWCKLRPICFDFPPSKNYSNVVFLDLLDKNRHRRLTLELCEVG